MVFLHPAGGREHDGAAEGPEPTRADYFRGAQTTSAVVRTTTARIDGLRVESRRPLCGVYTRAARRRILRPPPQLAARGARRRLSPFQHARTATLSLHRAAPNVPRRMPAHADVGIQVCKPDSGKYSKRFKNLQIGKFNK
jgi:hypothetical protein